MAGLKCRRLVLILNSMRQESIHFALSEKAPTAEEENSCVRVTQVGMLASFHLPLHTCYNLATAVQC